MEGDATKDLNRVGASKDATPVAAQGIPLRIDRAQRNKRVSGPLPWVMIGLGRVWGWEQSTGLVRLTGLEEPGQLSFGWDALSIDGRYLFDQPLLINDFTRRAYDIQSGQWQARPDAVRDYSLLGTFPREGGEQRLDVYRTNPQGRPTEYLNGRYVLHRGDEVIELPLDEPHGAPVKGPQVQFSPSGEEVAITHFHQSRGHLSASVINLSTEQTTRYDGLGVATCGSWSPLGTRLLLGRLEDLLPTVVDRASGSTRSLREVLFAHSTWVYAGALVSGWLDETRVLISGRFGRRIVLATLDVDTGERVDLLDLPKPPGSEYYGIRYAPALAQADPSIVGPMGWSGR